jgi:hypothetical protein
MKLDTYKLAEKAGLRLRGYGDYWYEAGPKGLEKFAELIVRECATYAYPYDQERNSMLKFFGLKPWWRETTKKENIKNNVEELNKTKCPTDEDYMRALVTHANNTKQDKSI